MICMRAQLILCSRAGTSGSAVGGQDAYEDGDYARHVVHADWQHAGDRRCLFPPSAASDTVSAQVDG